jgi:hypothetical protein
VFRAYATEAGKIKPERLKIRQPVGVTRVYARSFENVEFHATSCRAAPDPPQVVTPDLARDDAGPDGITMLSPAPCHADLRWPSW